MIIHLIRTRLVAADHCCTYKALVPMSELTDTRVERITYRTLRSTADKADVPHADLADAIAPHGAFGLPGLDRFREWQRIQATGAALEFALIKLAFPELRQFSKLRPIVIYDADYPTAEFIADCPLPEGAFLDAADPATREALMHLTAIRPVRHANEMNAALIANPPAYVAIAWENPDTGKTEPDLLARDDAGRYVDANGLVHAQSITHIPEDILQVWQTEEDYAAALQAKPVAAAAADCEVTVLA